MTRVLFYSIFVITIGRYTDCRSLNIGSSLIIIYLSAP